LEAAFGVSMAGYEDLVPTTRPLDAADRDSLITAVAARLTSIESAGGTPSWAVAMLAAWLAPRLDGPDPVSAPNARGHARAEASGPIDRAARLDRLLATRAARRHAWQELRTRLHLPRLAFPGWARLLFHVPTMLMLALAWPISRSGLLPPEVGGVAVSSPFSVPDLGQWLYFATAILASGFLVQFLAERRWGWRFPAGLATVGDLADVFVRQGGDTLWTVARIRVVAGAALAPGMLR